MGKGIHKLTFYTLILVVYGVFFSVQSFYNFEGHSEAREIIGYSSFLHSLSARAGAKVMHAGYQHAHHKIRLRLNKRFHQEDYSPCAVYEVVAPVIYFTQCEPGSLVVRPLPAVTLRDPQLRGPPIGA